MTVIEVFADVGCPFTHVGLRRFVERRASVGRTDVALWVRAWPLELVNGEPLDSRFVAEEVDAVRRQVAPESFVRFAEDAFPSTSLPAMALAAAAYRRDRATGEAVSLELRDLLFERGTDISDPAVLERLATTHGLRPNDADAERVRADFVAGEQRGVIGSPHFFTPAGGFFCPALEVSRDDQGHLRVLADPDAFDRFMDSCLV